MFCGAYVICVAQSYVVFCNMNTTKKSSLDNSPYQNARTSPLEPKARKMRSSSAKGNSTARKGSARSESEHDPYSAAPKAKERRKSTSSAAPYVYGQVPVKGERKSRSSKGSSSESPYGAPESKRSSSKAKSSHNKRAPLAPERSLAEDAEILRRFKSLMQKGSENPVTPEPYPTYQVDEMGNVIHKKGANRPKAEVKVVVRRKRTLINDADDNTSVASLDTLENTKEPSLESVGEEEQIAQSQAKSIDENLLRAAAMVFDQEASLSQNELTDTLTDSTALSTKTPKKRATKAHAKKKTIDEQSVATALAPTETPASEIDNNLLRAAAIVFAQDPVMGVSKEQSLALGITSHVANAILQEQNPTKKKKRNKLTAVQKAEAEAQAAAAAAQEAAAIVALSKHFSTRNISQAESSLAVAKSNYQAVAVDPILEGEGKDASESTNHYHSRSERLNISHNASTQALLNKLARTQAQLEKDDTLPDNFELDYQEPSEPEHIAPVKATAKHKSKAKSKAASEVSESVLNPYANSPSGTNKAITKRKRARNSSVASDSKDNNKSTYDATYVNSKTVTAQTQSVVVSSAKGEVDLPQSIVETKSTILSGANDTAITIKVKRRASSSNVVSSESANAPVAPSQNPESAVAATKRKRASSASTELSPAFALDGPEGRAPLIEELPLSLRPAQDLKAKAPTRKRRTSTK